MLSLYNQAAQMLIDWSGEDVAGHTNPRQVSKEIVDMIVRDLQQNGFPALELVAAHDGAQND